MVRDSSHTCAAVLAHRTLLFLLHGFSTSSDVGDRRVICVF